MRRLIVLICLLIVGISVAPSIHNPLTASASNTYHVGEDSTSDCFSVPSNCSFASALSRAVAGDTIDLMAGTYDDLGATAITKNGSSGSPITFTADTGAVIAYDYANDCTSGVAPGPLLEFKDSSYINLTGLTFDGESGAPASSSQQCTLFGTSPTIGALYFTGLTTFSNIIVDGVTVKHVLGDCILNDGASSTYVTVQNSTISDCTADNQGEGLGNGIDLASAGHDTIYKNQVNRSSADGIYLNSTGGTTQDVTYNTVYNSGFAGLRTGDTNIVFDHNTIWNSGRAGIQANTSETITYNDIVSTTQSGSNITAIGSTNGESAIRFTGTGSGEIVKHNDIYFGSNPNSVVGSGTPEPTSVAIRQVLAGTPSAGNTIMCNIVDGIPEGSPPPSGTPPPIYGEQPIDRHILAAIPGQTIIANDYWQNIEPTSTVETLSTPVDPGFVSEPGTMALNATVVPPLVGACPGGSDIGSGF